MMNRTTKLILTALTLLPLAGCLDEEGVDDEIPETTAEARCTPNSVQSSDTYVDLSPDETVAVSGTPDGTLSCAAFVVSYNAVNEVRARIRYGTAYAPVFTQATCAAQQIRMQLWTENPFVTGGFSPIVGTRKSASGTWLSLTNTCLQPSVSYESGNYPSEVLGGTGEFRTVHRDVRLQVETLNNTTSMIPVTVTGTYDSALN